mmetsp:Transcript_7312/g.19947  ORF Transcript_7312/g.19947 Transcript_7312/m.19947 type:complete len:221 (+) Transcript_7312:132-794(+)
MPSSGLSCSSAWRTIQSGISVSSSRSIIARCSMFSCMLSGRCPRYSMATMQPALQMSELSSQGSPSTISGARYCRVPTCPGWRSSGKTAPPKSMTASRQLRSLLVSRPSIRGCGTTSWLPSRNMTLRHFRSVCVRPMPCRNLRLCSSCCARSLTSASSIPRLSFSFRKSRMLVSSGSNTMHRCRSACRKLSSISTQRLSLLGSKRWISCSISTSASACSQ